MAKLNKTILITGGAGFIGTNFIHYILEKYPRYRIINLDKLTYAGNLANLADISNNPRYQFIKGDIADETTVQRIFKTKKPQIVVNFAAESHVDRSILDPQAFMRSNIFGVYILLEAVKKYGIGRFIQISTDEVYGSVAKGKPNEQARLLPSSPYSSAKASADLLCQSYYKTFHLPILITRSSNNFGPWQYPEKLIPLFITNLLENKPIPLYGTGKNIRDWIYVIDNCRGIDLVWHKGKIGEIYNLGGYNEKNNLEITNVILDKLNKNKSWIKRVADRPGHDLRYALNNQKIRRLGWKPIYSFAKGMRLTIDWYQQHQDWWTKIKSGVYRQYYKKQYKK